MQVIANIGRKLRGVSVGTAATAAGALTTGFVVRRAVGGGLLGLGAGALATVGVAVAASFGQSMLPATARVALSRQPLVGPKDPAKSSGGGTLQSTATVRAVPSAPTVTAPARPTAGKSGTTSEKPLRVASIPLLGASLSSSVKPSIASSRAWSPLPAPRSKPGRVASKVA